MADDTELDRRDVTVTRLPQAPNEVKIDNVTGGMVVDGKPFIPVGFYCYTNHTADDHPQPRLAAAEAQRGFNMMSPYQSCVREHRRTSDTGTSC